MEQVRVQVLFSEETPYGTFTDALYFTPAEYELRKSEVKSMKDERVASYVSAIESAPPAVEPTKKELEAEKASLIEQKAVIEARVAQLDWEIAEK